jgi:hypothetical protein
MAVDSAGERCGGKPVQIIVDPGVRKGARGPDYVACVFVGLGIIIICRLYKLTLSNQIKITLQLRVSLSNVVQRYFVGPSLLGGPPPLFLPGPRLAVGGSDRRSKYFLQDPALSASVPFSLKARYQVSRL